MAVVVAVVVVLLVLVLVLVLVVVVLVVVVIGVSAAGLMEYLTGLIQLARSTSPASCLFLSLFLLLFAFLCLCLVDGAPQRQRPPSRHARWRCLSLPCL